MHSAVRSTHGVRGVFVVASVVFILACFAAYAIEYDTGTGITLSADIVSATAVAAYDGTTPNTRRTVGIGETVNLSLNLSSFNDPDRCRVDENSPWVQIYDSLGGANWVIQSGPGALSGSGSTATYRAWKQAVDSSTIIEARVYDVGPHGSDNDGDLVKTATFSNKKPSGLTFISKTSPCACWAAYSAGPPNNIIGGGLYRNNRVALLNVNLGALSFSENIPQAHWTWNDGTNSSAGPFVYPFNVNAQGYVQDDHHDTGSYPISYLSGSAQATVSWPGTFGWNMESGGYYGGINWIHDFSVTASGVTTLVGNGDTQGGFGPWQ